MTYSVFHLYSENARLLAGPKVRVYYSIDMIYFLVLDGTEKQRSLKKTEIMLQVDTRPPYRFLIDCNDFYLNCLNCRVFIFINSIKSRLLSDKSFLK